MKWLVEIEQVWATGQRQTCLMRELELYLDGERRVLAEGLSISLKEFLSAAIQIPEGLYRLELRLYPIKPLPVPATAPPAAPKA